MRPGLLERVSHRCSASIACPFLEVTPSLSSEKDQRSWRNPFSKRANRQRILPYVVSMEGRGREWASHTVAGSAQPSWLSLKGHSGKAARRPS